MDNAANRKDEDTTSERENEIGDEETDDNEINELIHEGNEGHENIEENITVASEETEGEKEPNEIAQEVEQEGTEQIQRNDAENGKDEKNSEHQTKPTEKQIKNVEIQLNGEQIDGEEETNKNEINEVINEANEDYNVEENITDASGKMEKKKGPNGIAQKVEKERTEEIQRNGAENGEERKTSAGERKQIEELIQNDESQSIGGPIDEEEETDRNDVSEVINEATEKDDNIQENLPDPSKKMEREKEPNEIVPEVEKEGTEGIRRSDAENRGDGKNSEGKTKPIEEQTQNDETQPNGKQRESTSIELIEGTTKNENEKRQLNQNAEENNSYSTKEGTKQKRKRRNQLELLCQY